MAGVLLAGRPRYAKTFDAKADTNAWLSNAETDINRSGWIDPNAGRVTFKEYAEEWRANQIQQRPGTKAQIETHLRRHVYPFIGDRPLAKFKPSHIQTWVKVLHEGTEDRKPLAPATIEVIYSWVSTIFEDGGYGSRPCRQSVPEHQPPASSARPHRAVVRREGGGLIEAVPDQYRALVVLGAGTGLRL